MVLKLPANLLAGNDMTRGTGEGSKRQAGKGGERKKKKEMERETMKRKKEKGGRFMLGQRSGWVEVEQ